MVLSRAGAPCTYVILAHDYPEATLRLADQILSDVPKSRVAIHYSAFSGTFPLTHDARITVIENPVAVRWGTFSQIEMMLLCLRQIEEHMLPDAWIVFLSGHCYPARPLEMLEDEMLASDSDAIMWHRPIEPRDHELHDRYAFKYRHVNNRPLSFPFSWRPARGLFNRLQSVVRVKSTARSGMVGTPAQAPIFDVVPQVYFGSQWFALSRRASLSLRTLEERKPEFVEAYRDTMLAEESFFATALRDDPALVVKASALHYVDWSNARSGSPVPLQLRDIGAIKLSRKWFARKITVGADDGLRDALDVIRSEERTAALAMS